MLENEPTDSASPTCDRLSDIKDIAPDKEAGDATGEMVIDSPAARAADERADETSNIVNYEDKSCINNGSCVTNNFRKSESSGCDLKDGKAGDSSHSGMENSIEREKLISRHTSMSTQSRDNDKSSEVRTEIVEQNVRTLHECSTKEDKVCRFSLFGLDRDALDPVVSVEKLEPSEILCERDKCRISSNSSSHKTDDSGTGIKGGLSVESDEIRTIIKPELVLESPAEVVYVSGVRTCCDATGEPALLDSVHTNACKSEVIGENDYIACKKSVNELQAGVHSDSTGKPESFKFRKNSSSYVDTVTRQEETDLPPCNSNFQVETALTSVCASDIIPKDEATKICDALLQTLSPVVVDSEPEEKFIVSIQLDKLKKRIQPRRASRSLTRSLSYASKQHTRLTRRNKDARKAGLENANTEGNCSVVKDEAGREDKDGSGDCFAEEDVSVKSNSVGKKCANQDHKGSKPQSTKSRKANKEADIRPDSRDCLDRSSWSEDHDVGDTSDCKRDLAKQKDPMKDCPNEGVKTELDGEFDERRQKKKLKKHKLLPKRTTRHSKPIQEEDIPDKLIVSINLDSIDSYCQDEEKPACLLSTHTFSEGWMVQEEVSEDEKKKHFCIDDIFVDKKAFGVIKYRAVGEDGEVKEHLEILETRIAPANYIWPKDEDGRETERLLVQTVAKEEKEKLERTKGCTKEDEGEVSDRVTNAGESANVEDKPAVQVEKPTTGFEAETESKPDGEHEGNSSTDSPMDLVKGNPTPTSGQLEDVAIKSSNLKRKFKDAKTRQKNNERASHKQVAPRKTRSQTARKEWERSNKEDVSGSKLEIKTNTETVEKGNDSVDVSQQPLKTESAEDQVKRGEVSNKMEDVENYEPALLDDDKEQVSESSIAAVTSDLHSNKDYRNGDGELSMGRVEQSEKVKVAEISTEEEPTVPASKKPGRVSKSRKRRNDASVSESSSDPKKALRPRRGQYQLICNVEGISADSNATCEDIKENSEIDIKHGESRNMEKSRELKGADDGVKVDCKAGDIVSEGKHTAVADPNNVMESEESEKCVVDKKNAEAFSVNKLKSLSGTLSKAESTEIDIEKCKDMREGTAAVEGSITKEAVVKSDINTNPEDESGENRGEGEETRCNVKMINKESSIEFTPDENDSDKSDMDSFQNSPARFQEDFSEMHRSSVATSIMSSMVTSLNSELFMNSCDLEFTLPGMSKDVLVKGNGNVVKSNEIEDCLRLPPADEKDNLDNLPQNSGLPCPEGVLHSEIVHRQSLLSSDVQMGGLLPYRDTSKFFNITPEEGTNGEFENGPQRLNREFQRGDTFLTGGNRDSPFQPSEADINLKAGDSSAADKWDRVLMKDSEGLIEKSQITELVDDPFMNSNELRSGSNPDESLLTEVENFAENDMANSPCNDDTFDIPDTQFENVDIPTEGFECGQELVEDPTVNMEYTKETSEGYSSGSSTDEDDEDEDSDSSETDDTDDSSSSSSSRSDDDEDDDEDDDDDDDDDDEEDSEEEEEEESESSDSESDINEDIGSEEVCLDNGIQGGIPSPSCDASKEPFTTVAVEEVIFQDSEILPIEKKECREFFMGKLSKTPEKYLDIRKFIINEWSKMRPAYLTKNSIRSKVDPTDANAVARVFMFLENIGAINVGCSVKNKWVERMERRRVKYFNAKRTENVEGSSDEQKRKRGRPPSLTNEPKGREVFLDFSTITEEERKANPQFFSGNKNKSPEKYLKMRNSIINCWMDSKPTYLTKQAARMAMSWYCGDVNAISRVHDYLEKIGAINFGCAQEPRRGRPSRGRINQDKTKPGTKCKEYDIEKETMKAAVIDSKATRMKNAQKKLEDISREVELEIGKPIIDCDIGPYDIYGTSIHKPSNLSSRKSSDAIHAKTKSKRGRKPKIRQCEPDSTVHDENLLTDKDLAPPPKNGIIPEKEIWESGPASDKSSVGDSGFDSVSEISPLLEPETLGLKPSLVQDVNMPNLEDETDEANYPMPTEEKIIDISMISEEEKLGCPEFFVGSKVKPPEKYVKIRDSILRSWHNKKPFYLNKHNARCDMPWYTGDINSIGRVHAYLERIGAINYQAVHMPKRTSRVSMCRKRKLSDSPRYEAPSPETEEDDDEMSDKLMEGDLCNDDLITREERDAFKQLLTDGNCVNALSNGRSAVRDVISEIWAKCKQKYVSKVGVDRRYADDYVHDDEDVDNADNDSSSDVTDETYMESRALINGTYSETGKNGVWDMTKTFSLGLRPRKRWKMDINQDWIDRTESEGFTVKVCWLENS